MTGGETLETESSHGKVERAWLFASALERAVTPVEVAEAVAREGASAVEASIAGVALLDRTSGRLRVVRPSALPGGDVIWSDLELVARSPAADVIRQGSPVLVASIEEMATRYPDLLAEMADTGHCARAGLPLHAASGELVGVIGFGWRVPQAFPEAQLRRLDLVAQLAGLALGRSARGHDQPWLKEPASPGLETMPSAFFSVDTEFRITYLNLEAERALGFTRDQLVGRVLFEAFPQTVGSGFERRYREAMETGRPVVFEEYSSAAGTWVEVHAWPGPYALNVSFWDVSERRSTEARQAAALSEAAQTNAHLTFLGELSSRLSDITNEAEVFECLSRAVIPAMADWCTLVVPRGEELVRVAAVHRDPVLDGLARRLVGSYPHAFSGPSPGVAAYRSGEPIVLERLAQQIIADLDDSAASAAYGRTLVLLGDGPGLIVPIHAHGEVVAVLTMIRSNGESFGAADVGVMGEASARVAAALDDARRIATERATASALQEAALPKTLPCSATLNIAARYLAASGGSQVGGDWYDAFEVPSGRIALVVGDAAGHGLQAAALMAQMRNALRAYLFASLGPAGALSSLRRMLAVQEPDAFATIICAEVDRDSGDVVWASAGHPAPILVTGDGTSAYLNGKAAPPIGWTDAGGVVAEVEHRLSLAPKDRLVMFTDGLVERRGVEFDIGLTHLMILVEQLRAGTDAAGACEAVFEQVLPSAHEDDVCLLIADYRPGLGEAPQP